MRVAVIGRGKAGSAVITGLGCEQIHDIYHSTNLVTVDKLQGADVVIVFVPGMHFATILPILIKANIPVVCGVTGFDWPERWQQRLIQPWICAHNFSLAMYFVRQCLGILGKIDKVVSESTFALTETHHADKVDAPSGTALHWRDWLGQDCEITAKRTGDVKGFHQLAIDLPFETITLSHNSKNRQLFAQGAIWAARYLQTHDLPKGSYGFHDILSRAIESKDPANE